MGAERDRRELRRRRVTLQDLQALPQTEMTVTQVCYTSAINSPFAANIPMKGVLLSDVIEACGGLAGGTNTFALAGADGGQRPISSISWCRITR